MKKLETTDATSHGLLGKETPYCSKYDASLLFAIPRQEKRKELGICDDNLPFSGLDIWTSFELSWLNLKGKPISVMAEFAFQGDSPYLIESKSFKLYLNSFSGSKFESQADVEALIIRDLTQVSGNSVDVIIHALGSLEGSFSTLPGYNLDELDIEVNEYQVNPMLLETEDPINLVDETLNSHLLKSNCLVTGQPDWGSFVIRYQGQKIKHEALLKYIISFREHNEFHEQCVERIFMDILKQCQPKHLTVYARYVRRGGLDINPYRSNFETEFDISRLVRQ
ncbi:NADPH-dependent 7-cyano-7-deazaguanine reductase [hydrothermal vent metagenome]|uniref:NADPH-dependent 7-cyano-7-deazaguanine reductase n=1 Tax=hydrothermal vent metagenome TaxID=652676 RepID=A0A3B0WA28_9ZZZZ